MGSDRRTERRRGPLSTPPVVRVVPDLPTFAVDDGFAYTVPEGMSVEVGSIVRVPLGGRRVRGWVVATGESSRTGLRTILTTSGEHPVFTRRLLEVVRWAAIHYVAPLAALIGKTAPPNLPKGDPPDLEAMPEPFPDSATPALSAAAAAGGRVGTTVWAAGGDWAERIAGVAGPVLGAERSVLVVAPTVIEAEELGEALLRWFGERVRIVSSERPAAGNTRAWVAVQRPGRILVGTRETAFWPVAGLSLAVIVGDGRRGLKDKATPTTHARDVLVRRSVVERFSLLLSGVVPAAEGLARASDVVASARPWGLVEVVDRAEEPPGRGVVAPRTRAAIHAVTGAGGRVFLFTDRRAPAMRCVRCRALRTCPNCGARPDRDASCPRCGSEIGACPSCGGQRFEPLGAPVDRVIGEVGGFLGKHMVGDAAAARPVVVGTERDVPTLGGIDLAVVVDADGLVRAPHYRAVEDGFRVMARVVAAAGSGKGRRAIVQTADPGHPAIVALRRADPIGLLRAEIDIREPHGFPPHGELVVLEAEHAPQGADGAIREAVGERGTVLGPARRGERHRWLLQGTDLRPARVALRGMVQDWRDAGARVRIDADPIDL